MLGGAPRTLLFTGSIVVWQVAVRSIKCEPMEAPLTDENETQATIANKPPRPAIFLTHDCEHGDGLLITLKFTAQLDTRPGLTA